MTRALQLAASLVLAYGILRWIACPALLRRFLFIPLALALFSAQASLVFAGLPIGWVTCIAIPTSFLPWLAGKAPDQPAPSWREANWSMLALLALAVTVDLAVALEHFHRFPDGGWDAWMIWNAHARRLWRAATFREAFDPMLSRVNAGTHFDYPLGLPGMIVQFYGLWGRESLLVSQILSVASAILCAGILYASLIALAGPSAAAYGAAALLGTPIFAIAMTTEYADLWVALFALGGWSVLLLPDHRQVADRSRALLVAGTFLGLTFFMKNEGMVFLAVTFFLVAFQRRRVRDALIFLAGAAPWVALVLFSKHQIGITNDLLAGGLGASIRRLASLSRWAELLVAAGRRLVYFQAWGAMVGCAVLFIVYTARGKARSPAWRLLPGIGVIVATQIVVLATTPYDVTRHVQTAFDRLMLQCWPAVLFAVVSEARGRFPVLFSSTVSGSSSRGTPCCSSSPASSRARTPSSR